jgi:hypothetical protein
VEDPVNKGCFPMIDMRNDCDISDILHLMNLITFSEIGCKGTPKNGMNLIFT